MYYVVILLQHTIVQYLLSLVSKSDCKKGNSCSITAKFV